MRDDYDRYMSDAAAAASPGGDQVRIEGTAVQIIMHGEATALKVFASDDRDLRLNLLWQADGANDLVPLFDGPDRLLVGHVLDVVEHRPNGMVRRTLWRLPARGE